MIDITNTLYAKIKASVLKLYPEAKVEKKSQETAASFPCVTIVALDNPEIEHDLTYGGRKSNPSWQIDIYANGSSGEIVALKIRDAIVPILETMRLRRTVSRPVENVKDPTIYRYMLRYDCKIDEDTGLVFS
jgi:hypothetical protein